MRALAQASDFLCSSWRIAHACTAPESAVSPALLEMSMRAGDWGCRSSRRVRTIPPPTGLRLAEPDAKRQLGARYSNQDPLAQRSLVGVCDPHDERSDVPAAVCFIEPLPPAQLLGGLSMHDDRGVSASTRDAPAKAIL